VASILSWNPGQLQRCDVGPRVPGRDHWPLVYFRLDQLSSCGGSVKGDFLWCDVAFIAQST
jgi:hypothetical protein